IERIALHRLTARVAGEGWQTGAALGGTLFLPGGPIAVRGRVVSVRKDAGAAENLVECALDWPDAALRDRLDVALHASCWYRPIAGQREAASMRVAGRRLFRRRENPGGLWRPVLFRAAGDHEWRGGYVRTSRAELAAFAPLAPGTVLDFAPGEGEMRQVVSDRLPSPLDADAGGPSSLLVHGLVAAARMAAREPRRAAPRAAVS
ncbi:MAG: hypothetical protein KIT16_23045, partial [Rhodospirillaceae bacterium]|nr:hypothetical protein [Rhodospirillaceae bacterium]